MSVDDLKRRAAEAAVALVEDRMVLGLGSGSTAELALYALAARVSSGLQIVGIPTSERTATLAGQLGIPLTDFSAHARLDLTIDGADEVEASTLSLIKGRGGALLREKIVATASRRMAVIVEESKLVPKLGRGPLPLEIVPFGWPATLDRLADLGLAPVLRRTADGAPVVTDGGNLVFDCKIPPSEDLRSLDGRLHAVVGVIETGLFIDLVERALVGGQDGLIVLFAA
jgi:ribose 5-phosphate isomerase A